MSENEEWEQEIHLYIPAEVRASFATVLKGEIYRALYAGNFLSDRELELLCSSTTNN